MVVPPSTDRYTAYNMEIFLNVSYVDLPTIKSITNIRAAAVPQYNNNNNNSSHHFNNKKN